MIDPPNIIERKFIGDIQFTATIYYDENNSLAVAVTFHNYEEPLLLFQYIKNEKIIKIDINTSIFYHIQNLKSYDEELRKQHYKQFKHFVILTNIKAKKIAYGESPIQFKYDFDLNECIRQAYIFN